ncbi:hypothetical protein LIER_19459 [Lithospermum erythrorhizon]|uniref:Uncharacterized protein n=1 Tax=Lithospermum erythrorhizon TaxID=34254 RepID=A0AAV3QHW0_LITER
MTIFTRQKTVVTSPELSFHNHLNETDPIVSNSEMANQMAPSVGNDNQVHPNTSIPATQAAEQQRPMDIPGPSEQQPIPPKEPVFEPFTQEDIREEIQRRVRLAREQEIQRQVEAILERYRVVKEDQERLDEEARQVERRYRERESFPANDRPYTPTYSPLYTDSMIPEYGSARSAAYQPSVVHQTVPPVDHTTAILR